MSAPTLRWGAVVHCTIFTDTPTSAVVAGSAATLTLPGAFYMPGDFTLTAVDGSRSLHFTEPAVGHDALYFQAAAAARRITAGELESPLRTLDDSIATLRVMDEIRRQIGVRFEGE